MQFARENKAFFPLPNCTAHLALALDGEYSNHVSEQIELSSLSPSEQFCVSIKSNLFIKLNPLCSVTEPTALQSQIDVDSRLRPLTAGLFLLQFQSQSPDDFSLKHYMIVMDISVGQKIG